MKTFSPQTHVNNVLIALKNGISDLIGDKIIGIYLFGSLTYDDFNPKRSDIDLLVITKDILSEEELKQIKEFHVKIEENFKEWKERIECSYTPFDMFKNKLPYNLKRPYHGAGIFYPTATYGNEWLINNYLIYNHGIALVGPDIKTLIKSPKLKDVQEASVQDLYKEWVPKIINKKWLDNSHYQSYLILNLCRILMIVINGEASSKSVSAEWVKNEYAPQWKNLIEEADKWEYGKKMNRQDGVIEFLKFTVEKIKDKHLK